MGLIPGQRTKISHGQKKKVWDEKYTVIKNWWDIAEEMTSELGDMATETTQNETESEGPEDSQQSLTELWGNPTLLIHAQPQPPRRERWGDKPKYLKQWWSNISELHENTNSQEVQQIPIKSDELGMKEQPEF